VYIRGWSKEEAEAEAVELFGKHPSDWKTGKSLVCDSCFNRFKETGFLDELIAKAAAHKDEL